MVSLSTKILRQSHKTWPININKDNKQKQAWSVIYLYKIWFIKEKQEISK